MTYIHIGVGGFGQYWCTAVLPRLKSLGLAEAVAAVDIDRDVLPKAKEQLGLSENRLYTSAEQALTEREADFVTIVVPPAFHEEMVDLAVRHGCHILSEKPIADSMEGCCRIYRKVKDAGLKMAVTMSHRFDQDKQSLERLIHSGRYGQLDYIVGRNTWTCRWRGQWGQFRYDIADPLLVEGTVHHFDIMRSLSGANAKWVHCLTWNPGWSEFHGDSQALVLLEMTNGVKVFYEGAKANASQLNGWSRDYWRAECEQGTLILDNRQMRLVQDLKGERVEEPIDLDEREVWTHAWLAQMFCEWLGGGDSPPTTIDDNIQCSALLFAAIESAHTGKMVDVAEFLRRHMEDGGR
ncbi:MAG: Gfo/Idh/MocA family oxidoreductase [Planctomycetes bacterium]|nr:Gfo/Idh/MocA family oxidoreductase [Planctomycetota bacterium]